MDGRPSLYPDTDFCANPGLVCNSQDSDELPWVVGMFHWMNTVQSYARNRWVFMDKLRELSLDDVTDIQISRMLIAVDCIMKTGNHVCDIGVDSSEALKEVLAVFGEEFEQVVANAPSASPTVSTMPSASPTNFPTGKAFDVLLIFIRFFLDIYTHSYSLTFIFQFPLRFNQRARQLLPLHRVPHRTFSNIHLQRT